MIRRVLIAGLLAFIILMLFLWPLGHVGLYLYVKRGAGVSGVSLQNGAIQAILTPRSAGKLLERDECRIGLGHWLTPMPPGRLYQYKSALGVTEVAVSLLWPTLAAIPALALLLWSSRRRRRHRLTHHICLACGFQRPSAEGPCPECGSLQSDLKHSSHRGIIARDALIAALLCMSAITWAMVYVHRTDQRLAAQLKARVFDYSWHLEKCTPRLSGKVYFAQPGSGLNSLPAVLRNAGPGATIILLPGDHMLVDARTRQALARGLHDVWLLGSGPDRCTLKIELEKAERVRFEGMTIDCDNDPFLDCRDSMAVTLRNCKVINYNSGAGGSNAIFAVGSALLVEDCEFDGRGGRQADSGGSRGDPLDLRGDNSVYVRRTVFLNNDEIGRNPEMVLDSCSHRSDQRAWPPNSGVLVRQFDVGKLENPFTGRPFAQAIDDLEPLTAFARTRSLDAWSDPVAKELIDQIGIASDPDFWKRLLIHPKPEVRAIAQEKLRTKASPPPEGATETWLQQLDNHPISRDVVDALLSQPVKSRPLLEDKAKNGNATASANAKALLQLMDTQPPLTEILRAQDLDNK